MPMTFSVSVGARADGRRGATLEVQFGAPLHLATARAFHGAKRTNVTPKVFRQLEKIWVTWLEARARAISSVLRLAIRQSSGRAGFLPGSGFRRGAPGNNDHFLNRDRPARALRYLHPGNHLGMMGFPHFPQHSFKNASELLARMMDCCGISRRDS